MNKIIIKRGAFGEPALAFTGTPVYWADDVYFTVWPPGEPDSKIVQGACTLIDVYWTYMIEEGDFDTVGTFYWELAQYQDGIKLEPTCNGELEVIEGPTPPEAII